MMSTAGLQEGFFPFFPGVAGDLALKGNSGSSAPQRAAEGFKGAIDPLPAPMVKVPYGLN